MFSGSGTECLGAHAPLKQDGEGGRGLFVKRFSFSFFFSSLNDRKIPSGRGGECVVNIRALSWLTRLSVTVWQDTVNAWDPRPYSSP